MKRADFFKLWIEALRSGEYRQGKKALVNLDLDGKIMNYCCLGVACDVINKNRKSQVEFIGKTYLPTPATKVFGIREDGEFIEPITLNGKNFESLAQMNDSGVRFKTIARIIEEQLEAGNFRKP